MLLIISSYLLRTKIALHQNLPHHFDINNLLDFDMEILQHCSQNLLPVLHTI